MKTYIIRINGWSLKDKSHYMQNMVAEIAHQLGCREMGIYRYYAEEESWESLISRLDVMNWRAILVHMVDGLKFLFMNWWFWSIKKRNLS